MPFIIKSSKSTGTRTAQLTDNTGPSSLTPDCIEMLRGLTFKFEVKIADIIDEKSGSIGLESARGLQEQIAQRVQEALQKSTAVQSADPKSTTGDKPIFRYYPESDDNRPKTPVTTTEHSKEAQLADRLSRISVGQEKSASNTSSTRRADPDQSPFREPSEETLKETLKAVKFDQNYPIGRSGSVFPQDETQEDLADSIKPTLMIPPQVKSKMAPKAEAVASDQHKEEEKESKFEVGHEADILFIGPHEDAPPEGGSLGYLTPNQDIFVKVSQDIEKLADMLNEKEALKSVSIGQLVFAKSSDDNNWYRAVVEAKYGSKIAVDFIDWGMKEILGLKELREVHSDEFSLEKLPACAFMYQLKDTSEALEEEFYHCEERFRAKVLEYDQDQKLYRIKLLYRRG